MFSVESRRVKMLLYSSDIEYLVVRLGKRCLQKPKSIMSLRREDALREVSELVSS